MVLAQYQLLTEGLSVNHLRLILGTSMGCMHSFVWGEVYPDFMDALMPLACLPVQIAANTGSKPRHRQIYSVANGKAANSFLNPVASNR